MDTLLAIETADTTCGVAVWHEGACRSAAHIHRPRVHAARLAPLLHDTLEHAGLSPSQVDVVAVSAGPGSYTGLRIGMSTAKGFAMAWGIPLIPVPTLEAAAYALAPWVEPNDLVLAALDARRNDVFAAAYMFTHSEWSPLIDAGPYSTDALANVVRKAHIADGTLWCTGPGAEKAAAPLHNPNAAGSSAQTVRIVPAGQRALSARHVATHALHLAHEDGYEDPRTVEPSYLKAFHGTPRAKSL